MKYVVTAAAMMVAACSPAQAPEAEAPAPQSAAERAGTQAATDGAGNRLEALAQRGEQHCSSDGAWCIDAAGMITGPDGAQRAIITSMRDSEDRAPWPWIVRLAGEGQQALIGQTYRNNDMYSGGSASDAWLTLYEVSAASDRATPVMSVLLDGSAMIRACFDEGDVRERFDACHDEYRYSGALTLDTATQSGPPRLIYTTEAATYPGRRSRMSDSGATPPRSRADLVWVTDEACTFRHVYTRDDHAYSPDQPPPDCSDYRTQ